MVSAQKLYTFASTSFRDHMSHRLKLAVRFFMCVFFMLVFIEFWQLIGRENLIDIPFPIADICWYTSLTQMMLFMSPRLFMTIEEDVRSGDITYSLIRPIPYLWMRMSEGIGAMTANTLIYYTFGMACVYFYIGELPSGGLTALLTALFFLYFGSILHILYQAMAGITALWLQEAESVYRIYQKVLIVFGGLYMPLSLYPDWLQTWAFFTPVVAMMYGPIQFVLGENSPLDIQTLSLLMIFWFGFSIFLMGFIYRSCVARLEVNGG
jgi:ABC-2 type transport system permease protein